MRASQSRISRYFSLCLAGAAAWISPVSGVVAQDQTGSAQTGPSQFMVPDENSRLQTEIEQWIAEAKKSMDARDLLAAESAISKAEQLETQATSPLQLQVSPAALRQQLEQLRNKPVVSEEDAFRILLEARRSLAQGNLDQARQLSQQATASGFNYPEHGDTPARVDQMIGRHADLVKMVEAGDTKYDDMAARFLVEQASILLQYKDYEATQMLAQQAKLFKASFEPSETTPDQLLANVEQVVGKSLIDTNKGKASALLAEAKLAMDQGNLNQAQQLTEQAVALNVPDAAFGNGEVKPWQMELEINEMSRRMTSDVRQADLSAAEQNSQVAQADFQSDTTKSNAKTVSYDAAATEGTPDELVQSGMAALNAGQKAEALEYFQMAWTYRDQLDPAMQQAVQEQLQRSAIDTFASTITGRIDSQCRIDWRSRCRTVQGYPVQGPA